MNFDCQEDLIFDHIEILLTLGVIFSDDIVECPLMSQGKNIQVGRTECKNLNKVVRTLTRVCLLATVCEDVPFTPSQLAATCILLSR